MATFKITCVGCSKNFTSKSSQAKWCGPTCKQRAIRAKRTAALEAAADKPSDLELQVIADLEEAGKRDTFEGRLAVEIARRLSKAGPAGFTGLSRELRTVMASALGIEPATPPGASTAPEQSESKPADDGSKAMDEVRRRRDEKLAAARARADDGGADMVGLPGV